MGYDGIMGGSSGGAGADGVMTHVSGMMGYGGMMGGGGSTNYGYGMMGAGAGWGGMLLWWVLALVLFLAAVAAVTLAVVFAVRRNRDAAEVPSYRESEPAGILRKRFASGEIDDEEFRRRLAVLDGH